MHVGLSGCFLISFVLIIIIIIILLFLVGLQRKIRVGRETGNIEF